MRCDAALAVWVLQHCFAPLEDIQRIGAGLAPGGTFFVLNLAARAVPAMLEAETPEARFAWLSDGVDVEALLRAEFDVLTDAAFVNTGLPNIGAAGARIMQLRVRG